MPLGFLLRLPAMALEPFCVGGEIVLRRLGQLLRPGDGPPRGGDLRVDKADDVQSVRHRRYSTRKRVRCGCLLERTRHWEAGRQPPAPQSTHLRVTLAPSLPCPT